MWFQMLLTDGVLPSAMMTHTVKVLPASKEPQDMDGTAGHEMVVVGPGWIQFHHTILSSLVYVKNGPK